MEREAIRAPSAAPDPARQKHHELKLEIARAKIELANLRPGQVGWELVRARVHRALQALKQHERQVGPVR
ncbi:MAG TPA: hypothetical protein VGH09_12485 [Solirubrobacteraceae bacterium]